jgi:hypothetical protein
MPKRLSSWFSGHTKPTIPGVYERRWPNVPSHERFSYWDGRSWRVGGYSPDNAMAWRAFHSGRQVAEWRGLAKPSRRRRSAQEAAEQNGGEA